MEMTIDSIEMLEMAANKFQSLTQSVLPSVFASIFYFSFFFLVRFPIRRFNSSFDYIGKS